MRKPNWATLLNNYITDNRNTPFEWGKFDCCLFVAGAIEAMTGQDFGAPFKGEYSTAKGSLKALKKHGGGDLRGTFTQLFGDFKPRLHAKRGDVGLIDTEMGEAVGIMWGGSVWVVTEEGLTSLPQYKIKGCWEIPCQQ